MSIFSKYLKKDKTEKKHKRDSLFFGRPAPGYEKEYYEAAKRL